MTVYERNSLRPDQINVHVGGKGRVTVRKGGTEIVVEEKGAPRLKAGRKIEKRIQKSLFPEGAIDSLMPLLREPYLDRGLHQEESFWAELDARARFSPEKAVAKLKRAGIGHLEAAKALLARDEQLQVAKGFGHISPSEVAALESSVAQELAKLYAPVPPKK